MSQGAAGQRGWQGIAVGLAALTALLLALALPNRAAAEVVEAGSTNLELKRGLFRTLKAEGVEVAKVGPATVRGRVVSLPVIGGGIELASAVGSIEHTGGFKLRAGKRSVRLSELTLDTKQRGLYAKLDGKRTRIAAVPSFEFARAGFGDEIEVKRLRLNQTTTAALNRKLDLERVFRPGSAFAAVSSSFQPEAIRMTGGSMQFSLDPGTVAKLKTLDVVPVQFETAVVGTDPPAYSAPLLNGVVFPGTSRSWGMIEGGIRMARPGTPEPDSPIVPLTLPTLTWINLGVSLETQKLLGFIHAHNEAGQLTAVPGGPIAALDLSGATVQLDPATRTLSIANARATLEAPVANLINETFAAPKGKAPVLAAGDPFGTFSLTMQAG